MSADLYGEWNLPDSPTFPGGVTAWWHVTTNATNTRFTVEAVQVRTSDQAPLPRVGAQVFELDVVGGDDVLNTIDLWTALGGIVNAGPKTRNIPLKIQKVDGGVDSLQIEARWSPPVAALSKQ